MYQHMDLQGQPLPYAVGKVVCVGRSYQDHAAELNNPVPEEPLLFIKPSTSLTGLDAPLLLPKGLGAVHHELEVALLIGRRLCHTEPGHALEAVVGVGLALDLTLRDVQDRLKAQGHPWERAKAFDGSCPVTPFALPEVLNDLQHLDFSLRVNGEQRQKGNTAMMMWSIGELLAQMSRCFTLNPGDVVLTGTPRGVAELKPLDELDMQLNGQYRFSAKVAG
ncbi:2-keto-4-pentenoate hydratase/2-oxohepta-3-ene-1,7-dioic acid hydratase in catechol pathway [Oceanisphaera litoralis]|uniref:fumarylacetoacetate hydrolase family protein n=1 Tax=Oceanisphaera litoralis TaxID=225144 RepID=UPI00195ED37F|nr:fumarylacetoacetate hydrolase family protein [Oceanisphaera litoralis]MBM7454626.1 2-keto-4-pentenoate hydratase/2-oxohepta-3-ene-1,7-dioic acid hydratase in catechol pathway [Oceanisphaera litoralis]